MNKATYNQPIVEIIFCNMLDVIRTSGGVEVGNDWYWEEEVFPTEKK